MSHTNHLLSLPRNTCTREKVEHRLYTHMLLSLISLLYFLFLYQSPEEDGGGVPQEHTEQLVTPGTCEEMEEFERHSSSLSQYHLSLHLPRVCLHLPSKQFLETLYSRSASNAHSQQRTIVQMDVITDICNVSCRFATDLALWRPASPEQVERANAAKSLFFSSVDIQPAATAEEKVQMCKSVLRGQ